MRTRRIVFGIIAVYFAAVLVMGTARAAGPARWSHFRDHRTGNVLIVRTRCLTAEDSAATLHIRDYVDGGGTIRYGCARP